MRSNGPAWARFNTIFFVAVTVISAAFVLFTFAESSHCLDRITALTDARKAAREASVSLLDQRGASGAAADELGVSRDQAAAAAEARLDISLRGAVALVGNPKIGAAWRDFEASRTRLADLLAEPRPGSPPRLAGEREARIERCLRSLELIVAALDADGNESIARTKRRIMIAGSMWCAWTLVFGVASLVTERLRRRAAAARATLLQAGQAALEHEMGERRQAQEQLAFTTFHDELTGLGNRALLMNRLDAVVAAPDTRLWAVLFLDLDRFNVINESLGHAHGDRVLIETARRLERCLRSNDTLARLGGDEFILLLDDIEDAAAAAEIAQRLLRALDAPFTLPDHEVFVTASIGIALGRNPSDVPADIVRKADMAMHRAKQRGKQRVEVFAPEFLVDAVSRFELETDLAQALERREFCLFYQPLISMQTGRLVGFEALVRWRHPRRGMVNPDDFISLAEENGVIIPLGEWILNEAFRQLKEWQVTLPEAADLKINVNVSGKQLAAPDFIATVENALAASGLDPQSVNMEITESVLMSNAEGARAMLSRIKQLGIKIHLDDFGTGYSSLAYLREFPIDSLKIDRSFVSTALDSLTAGLASPAIISAIIGLAEGLSLSVTAEGTQTAAQVDALRELGCTNVQGFHFSRPLESVDAGAMIASAASVSANPAG